MTLQQVKTQSSGLSAEKTPIRSVGPAVQARKKLSELGKRLNVLRTYLVVTTLVKALGNFGVVSLTVVR